MTDTRMVISADRQLKDKVNFITWRREFERAAKTQDMLDLLNESEDIIDKPDKDLYLFDMDAEGKTTQAQAVIGTNNNSILWQADYTVWKVNRDKLKVADKLLDEWVCEGIKIEIKDCGNVKESYNLISSQYKVTDERARDLLLT